MCEDYPELTLPLENTILVNVDYDDYKSMKTVCDKYNKAVENIKNLWKGTARPDQLRTRPSSGKHSFANAIHQILFAKCTSGPLQHPHIQTISGN